MTSRLLPHKGLNIMGEYVAKLREGTVAPKINRISEPMNEKEVHMNAEEKMVRAVKKAAKKALAEAVIQQSAEAKASPVS